MAAKVRAVSSAENPLLVRLRRLAADPAAYRRVGEIWIEGEHLCAARAARGGAVPTAVIGESAWQQAGLRALAERALQVVVVPDAALASITTLESPAPIGFVLTWPGTAFLRPATPSVVLDRLQDAGNVGTLLRSAAAFGIEQVVALKGTAALWSPKVLRAGMGAHFGLHLVEGLTEDGLASWDVPMIGTSPHASAQIDRSVLPWPCAWVMGHEGQGVSAALAARCASTLRIPQPGGEESLNVAAAAAVCFYESARQRLGGVRSGRGPARLQ